MNETDVIYSTPLTSIADFSFDENVARVFPDMIRRSVPGYSTIIAMTGVMAQRYAQENSNCYDLGSSLGASTLSMRSQLGARGCRIIAVDNSAAMLERSREVLAKDPGATTVELVQADIRDVEISNASVVVMNFTLQFIPLEERCSLLSRIYRGMNPGGILVLSEKIRFEDPHLQELNTDLHHAFKRANGYSDLEISQKRTALEKVLLPETLAEHQRRLQSAGFASVDVWFQCFNFASLVALKPAGVSSNR